MTTIKNEIIRQDKNLSFVHHKVEEGCKLFNEDMPTEAKIAFSEAMRHIEDLWEEHPGDPSYLVSLAETHHILALAYAYIEDFDEARAHLDQALSLYQSIKNVDNIYIPILRFSRARVEHLAGNDVEAVTLLEKNLKAIADRRYDGVSTDGYVYGSGLLQLASIYYESDRYKKAVSVTKKAIELKKTRKECVLNLMPQEYIDLLNDAAHKAEENDDTDFHRYILEEGLSACRQAEAMGKKVNLLCYGTFYQDLLKLAFFNEEGEQLKELYKGLMAFCDRYLEQEPKLMKYKISGQLNYAVFCSKIGEAEKAEEVVCDAISGCSEIEEGEGPELTLFMVSALNVLANLKWERGDREGALRELSSQCKILSNYVDSHHDMAPSLLPLLIDLVLNQSRLLRELDDYEGSERLLEKLKAYFRAREKDYPQTYTAIYLMTLKKVADFHWIMEDPEKAKQEYHEVMYLLKDLEEQFPDIAQPIHSLHDEIEEILEKGFVLN